MCLIFIDLSLVPTNNNTIENLLNFKPNTYDDLKKN